MSREEIAPGWGPSSRSRAKPKTTNAFDPNDDGVLHINAYSKSGCELGRMLSNFAHSTFEVPDHGLFDSVEGYWYWLLAVATDEKRDKLRHMSGFVAKKYGRTLLPPEDCLHVVKDFQDRIKVALRCKLKQNKHILNALYLSTLPIVHYYYYGDKSNCKVTVPGGEWVWAEYELLRSMLHDAWGHPHLKAAYREMEGRTVKGSPDFYRPLPTGMSELLRADYRAKLQAPDGPWNNKLYTKGGLLLSLGYERIVVGDYGAYVEMKAGLQMRQHLLMDKWPRSKSIPCYWWMHPKGEPDVKVYLQNRGVGYADYKPGFYYACPTQLWTHNGVMSL